MADWLVAERIVFGVPTQNWMWLVAGVFLLSALAAVFTARRRPSA